MDYRVEALAAAAGVRVDTLRFYQSRRLLPPPVRVGRIGLYGDEHLARLRRIRSLKQQGFTLAQIQRVVSHPEAPTREPLLAALMEENVGERTLSRAQLAAEAGLPEVLVQAAESAGLIEALVVDGEQRFSEAHLEMARTGLAILEAGFPLQELLQHAVRHAQHVQETCDAAIDLFDRYVRHDVESTQDALSVTEIFRTLLPQATRLVALHFQRTLVSRALNRLRGKKQHKDLEAALAATEAARLEVEVTWR